MVSRRPLRWCQQPSTTAHWWQHTSTGKYQVFFVFYFFSTLISLNDNNAIPSIQQQQQSPGHTFTQLQLQQWPVSTLLNDNNPQPQTMMMIMATLNPTSSNDDGWWRPSQASVCWPPPPALSSDDNEDSNPWEELYLHNILLTVCTSYNVVDNALL